MKYKLIHLDTCISDFFIGHPKPVLQITVFKGMKGWEVIDALVDEYNFSWDYLMMGVYAWPKLNGKALREFCSSVLTDVGSDDIFPELDKYLEGDELVYAFFTWEEVK